MDLKNFQLILEPWQAILQKKPQVKSFRTPLFLSTTLQCLLADLLVL